MTIPFIVAISRVTASSPPVTGYRKSLTVESTLVPSTLTNFPVLVSLASDADLAAHAANDGTDIYITQSDGTTVCAHEIEKWDGATGELKLWFKANSLSSASDTTFYLYYGDGATYEQDPRTLWANSYEQVLHMTEASAALGFADNGIDYPFHTVSISPPAYRYVGTHDRTYIVWQGPGHDPYITYKDHGTGTWATPVQVGTNPLTNDHHGAPAVIVDNSGYIHVFYGNHNGAFEYAKSTNPEDISVWTAQTDVGSGHSYANLVKISDGTLYLFCRGSGATSYVYRTSADGFAAVTTFVGFEAGYTPYTGQFVYDGANDRVHFSFYIYSASAVKRLNIYHAYLNLSDGHVYSMAGTDLGTEMSRTEANASCIVYSSGTLQTQIPSLALDSSGNPHLVFAAEQADGMYDWLYTYWNGSAWATPEMVVAGVSAVSTLWGDLYVTAGGNVEAYLPVSYGGYGTSMEHYRRSSGSWSRVKIVLDTAKYGSYSGGFNYAHAVVNGTDALRWVFCSWALNHYSLTTLELFATDSNDNFLPAPANLSGDGEYLKDSTGKGYIPQKTDEGNPTGSASGIVAGAQSLDGTNDYLRFGSADAPSLDNMPRPTAVTLEARIKHQAVATSRWIIDGIGGAEGYGLFLDANGRLVMSINGGFGSATGSTVLDTDAWRYVAGRYNPAEGGTAEVRAFVDGVQEGTGDYATAIDYSPLPGLTLGAQSSPSAYMLGLLDEVRISSVARSADWLLATYRSINDPAAFVALGTEETL
jgi:hypothetical protein